LKKLINSKLITLLSKKYIPLLIFVLFLVSCEPIKELIKKVDTYEFKGTIIIYDNNKLENGTAVVNLNNITRITITDDNNFSIFLKSNQNNTIIIKVKNMTNYYDIIDTFIIAQNVKIGTFLLNPAPKSYDVYKDILKDVDTLIKITEKKLNEIQEIANNSIDPSLKRDLISYVLQKSEQIKYFKNQIEEKNKELINYEKLILSGAKSVTDISRLEKFYKGIDLIEKNTKNVYISTSRYRDILKNQETDNRYNNELKGKTFWERRKHTMSDLFKNYTSKQKILQLLNDINSLYNSFYMYPDNEKTIYLTIECSADKDAYNTRLDIKTEENYLIEHDVKIKDEDPTIDVNNYNLAFMRGYSLMHYIIENQICKSCNIEYTLIVYGSSRAPSTSNESIKKEHRFAKYAYRLLPMQN
jgi:hypothetical protein